MSALDASRKFTTEQRRLAVMRHRRALYASIKQETEQKANLLQQLLDRAAAGQPVSPTSLN